jgi:hypothetical protein
VSDEIVPDKNLGAAPPTPPWRRAEQPRAPTRGFSFEGGPRWTAAAHARGPPCPDLFRSGAGAARPSGQLTVRRRTAGLLLLGAYDQGLTRRRLTDGKWFRLKQAASPPLLLSRGKKDSALPRRLRLRRFANHAACHSGLPVAQMLLHIRHPELDLGRSAFLAGYAHAPC